MTVTTNPPQPPTPRQRRRSKRIRRIVISLAIVLGLLIAADFGAAAIFEYQVSKAARDQFDLSDDPSVKVGGFSFLTQAVSGEYDHVTIDAKGVPVRDTLRDLEVHVDLWGVMAPLSDLMSGSADDVKIREVEGEVRVKASDVNRALRENENKAVQSISNLTIGPVSEDDAMTDPEEGTADGEDPEPPENDGDSDEESDEDSMDSDGDDTTAGLQMCATGDIAGEKTNVCVFGIISLVQNKIKFMPHRLELRNQVLGTAQLPDRIEDSVLQTFAVTLDPGELPFTVIPTAVKVHSGSMSVKGEARDVVLGQNTR